MDTLHFERYEFKYFVPEERTEAIRRFIRPYVELDPHASRAADRRYTIHNIYLDSPNLELYNACVNGAVDRYKLRIRWYDDEAIGPFFFEVKRKIRQVIVKDRARVSRDDFWAMLRGEPLSIPEGRALDNLTAFRDRVSLVGAVPTLLSRYTREPYESAFGEYARLTLDRAMCYQLPRGYDLPEDPRGWTYVDAAWATGGVRCAIVLELKFTRDFPRWIAEAVKPEIVVISCLADYTDKKPKSPGELAGQVFGAVGAKVFVTAWHGRIEVVSDGAACTVKTERERK
jgi:hypothetical protein